MKANKILDPLHQINRINNELNSLYHTAALKLGLSDSAMFILYKVYENGGACPLYEIHNAGLCKQTVNSALRKLEGEGVLYLEPYKGKSKRAVFTERGRAFAKAGVGRLLSVEEECLSGWSDEDLQAIVALNQKYLDCFRARLERM